jgi:hypothetical protein
MTTNNNQIHIRFTDCAPIFIVGAGRSGTTLLQMMLNAHPNIAIYGELHYFNEVLLIKKKVPSLKQPEALNRFFQLVPNVNVSKYLPNFNQTLNAVQERMLADEHRTYEKFFRYVLEEYAQREGAKRFGEKTPTNIRYMNELLSIFPNAKIIHIIRDPRDVVASASKRELFWTSNDVVINAFKWRCDMFYRREFSAQTETYTEVRYEDLVSDPEQQLRRICEFVGEEFDPQMLEFYKTSKSYLQNEPWKEGTQRPINRSSVQKWQKELSEAQIFLIEMINGATMSQIGYELSRVSLSSKLVAPFVFLQEVARYIFYKYQEERRRKSEQNIIVGESKTLYMLFFKTLWGGFFAK